MAGRNGQRGRKSLQTFRRHALRIYPFCQWCSCPLTPGTATTDHLVPQSKGGTSNWGNLCLACWECNQKRKDDLPLQEPFGPRWTRPPVSRTAPLPEGPYWVAWTRYPGGRWRHSFRCLSLEEGRGKALKIFGAVAELVILLPGEEPSEFAGVQ